MASKPVTTDPPTISVEDIVREFYIEMKRELNLKGVADVLYARRLIDLRLKETIDRKEMTQDANELFLDHLIRNGTLETLRRFCEVLEETANSHLLPHHRAWSNKLKQKLTKVSRHKLNRISPSPYSCVCVCVCVCLCLCVRACVRACVCVLINIVYLLYISQYTTCSSDPTPQSSQDELSSTSSDLEESSSMMESSQGMSIISCVLYLLYNVH